MQLLQLDVGFFLRAVKLFFGAPQLLQPQDLATSTTTVNTEIATHPVDGSSS